MRKVLVVMGILLGFIGCKKKDNQVVYQYKDTNVYDGDVQIKKVIYTSTEMKLSCSGIDFSGNSTIECFDADFNNLGDEFSYEFKNNVLTIKSDFARLISGLEINEGENGLIYHFRYLDSTQFAWLVQELWLDDGWNEVGDISKYYSQEELKEKEEIENQKHQETLDTFTLLKGTWISDDESCTYTFSMSDEENIVVEIKSFNEETENYYEDTFVSEEAYQQVDDEEKTMDILLVNASHSSADFNLTYNMNDQTLCISGLIFYPKL